MAEAHSLVHGIILPFKYHSSSPEIPVGISIAPPHPRRSQSYKDSATTLFPRWENLCEGEGTNAVRLPQTYLPKKPSQSMLCYVWSCHLTEPRSHKETPVHHAIRLYPELLSSTTSSHFPSLPLYETQDWREKQ